MPCVWCLVPGSYQTTRRQRPLTPPIHHRSIAENSINLILSRHLPVGGIRIAKLIIGNGVSIGIILMPNGVCAFRLIIANQQRPFVGVNATVSLLNCHRLPRNRWDTPVNACFHLFPCFFFDMLKFLWARRRMFRVDFELIKFRDFSKQPDLELKIP